MEYKPPDVYPGYVENLHACIRSFMKFGWEGVSFPEGLALRDRK